MFTGIITGMGQISAVQPLGDTAAHGKRLVITPPAGYLDDVGLGDSIALNGACMTVTSMDPAAPQFTIDISAESLDKTTGLGAPGPINLEKALRANDRLGGHLVSGHVDGIGEVKSKSASGRAIDSQVPINNVSTEYGADVVATADGGFLVAYTGYRDTAHGGNNSYEVLLQRYSNTAPVLTDVFVSGAEDSSIVLTDALFISGFNDPEGQNLAAIKVTTLPAQGTLKLDGVDLIAGQEISLADLQAGKLTYQGDPDYFGLDQFAWTGSDGVAFAGTPVYTNINLDRKSVV